MSKLFILQKPFHFLRNCCFILLVLLIQGVSIAAEMETVHFTPDTKTVLRNPAMGWGLYADIVWKHPDPDYWWNGLEAGVSKANFFYYRCRWSTLEPEEGKYAWEHNDQFKKIIAQAKKYNLKLAFRVIVHSQDNSEQATPNYVRKAGANGFLCSSNKNFWDPYLDDPIFQEKFTAFVQAFGKAFDDPNIVDFVDGNGLGWWGEQHHLNLTEEQKESVLEWICSVYSSAFKRVLLVYCFGSEFGLARELRIAVNKYGYIPRRDGIGSQWFTNTEKEFLNKYFPDFPLIGESCYWSLDANNAWQNDQVMNFKSIRDVLEQSVTDAIKGHANTFDLRNPNDLKVWMREAPDLIEKFIAEGGYRLLPETIKYPKEIVAGKEHEFQHDWINIGCGVCPNTNPRWNKKYQVAFALFSETENPQLVAVFVDPLAEPSRWVKGTGTKYRSTITWNVPAGIYRLVVGIVDTTQNNQPAIRCAVANNQRTDQWINIGTINVKTK
ncbi:MAG: DUF4832 domain-containing protein [Planctomycetaceae bacterium]|jgi:hypothetical protein|nr:DUF4832 domain-containing protein [Planctomycetaceae bacterium]